MDGWSKCLAAERQANERMRTRLESPKATFRVVPVMFTTSGVDAAAFDRPGVVLPYGIHNVLAPPMYITHIVSEAPCPKS